MKTRSVIGVVQDDGRILAARVADGRNLGGRLERSYATRLRATMLVGLGAIGVVGPTPATSAVPDAKSDAELVDPCGFEAIGGAATTTRHVYGRDGRWTHWSEERSAAPGLMVEMED